MNNQSLSSYIANMTNKNNLDSMCKDDLFYELQFISFAIDDLRLFLDTHPCNSDAISFMTELMRIRHDILRIYTKKFGPIYSYDFNIDDGYKWNSEKLPWNKGGCK